MPSEPLPPMTLRTVLAKFVPPDVDVEGDGVFDLNWTSTTTFYNHTEEYVAPEKRAAYKAELERAIPGRRNVL